MKKIIFIVLSVILLGYGWYMGKCMDTYMENLSEIEKLRSRIKALEELDAKCFELQQEKLEENVSLVKTRQIVR